MTTGARPAAAADLRDRLLSWYDRHGRTLPWRAPVGRRAEPYHVLVSEVMLQQTTAATVSARFAPFLARFPSIRALAAAGQGEVLHAWQGLGYYHRARALHAAARVLVDRHGGILPDQLPALLALPGIGPYSARAIAAIAFDVPVVPVDGNVRRVMARLEAVERSLPAAAGELDALAAAFATPARPGDFAQALMDLGATVCTPRRPGCLVCPWQTACRARALGLAEALPAGASRKARPLRRGLAFLVRRPDGAILFRKRPERGLLGGLHELPSSPWAEGPVDPDEALAHAPPALSWRRQPHPVRHIFTHFELELHLMEGKAAEPPPAGLWCRPADLGELALPTVMRKLLRLGAVDLGKIAPAPHRQQPGVE
jgi:A/G-specific adenine glycosylase